MRNFVFIFLFVIGSSAFAQQVQRLAKSPKDFVPPGYVVVESVQGDLNKDNQSDHVLIIKGTDKKRFVVDGQRGKLDLNRRGIIVAIRNGAQYELALENRDCFSSENEDGGAYFPPELNVSINRGSLLVQYSHGRYGWWGYNFRYQNGDFELIGFDSSEDRGPVVERSVSINFMTKKMLVRENVNEEAQGGDEKFKEVWKKFSLSKPIKLREIDDFVGYDVVSLLAPVK